MYDAPEDDPWVSGATPSLMESPSRPTFEIYFDDDRYGIPTLHLLTTDDDDDAARATAERMLDENAHYRGAELWRDGRRLLGLGSLAFNGAGAPEEDG
jgi:hypothetical protein